MLNWLRSIDWISIAASALILAAVLVLLAETSPHSQANPGSSQESGQIVAPASTDERLADYTQGLEWFTGFLALVTIVLAGASIWQGVLTQHSISLARDEFNATHRPRLDVRFVREVANGAEITVINAGTGAAKFVSARAILVPVGSGTAIPSPHEIPAKGAFELRSRFAPSESDRHIVTETPDSFGAGFGGQLYVFGWIVYDTTAPTPIRRTTYFGRKVEPIDPILVAMEGSDWNFTQ